MKLVTFWCEELDFGCCAREETGELLEENVGPRVHGKRIGCTPYSCNRHLRSKYAKDFALLHGDGLSEVAGLVYVAAAADGDVIGEELERDYLENHT